MYGRALLILVLLMVKNVEALPKPIVTFNPNWNKIFTGESIVMTCDVGHAVEKDVTYKWFKDGYWIHSGNEFTISCAKFSDQGSYQCQTSDGVSESSKLEVHNSYVILQTSPYVYEGDNLTLRCHHYPQFQAKQTIFYKDNKVIKDWGPEDVLYIDMTSSSKYKCTKQVHHHLLYYQHSDETDVTVQELFSGPIINLSPDSVTEGDSMTLTCNTTPSPLRANTVLQYAFYRDERSIRGFGSSDKYEVQSATRRDAGEYKCEVKTSNQRIKKMSTTLTIQVKRKEPMNQLQPINQSDTEETSKAVSSHFLTDVAVTSLVLVSVLIFAVLILLYRSRRSLFANNQQPTQEPEDKTENIYTELDMNDRWTNSSQSPLQPNVEPLKTDKLFIV